MREEKKEQKNSRRDKTDYTKLSRETHRLACPPRRCEKLYEKQKEEKINKRRDEKSRNVTMRERKRTSVWVGEIKIS